MSNVKLGYVTDMRTLGNMLRLLRAERNQSIKEVAEAAGTSPMTLWRIEGGLVEAYGSINVVLKLLDYYGVAIRLEEREQ